MYLPFYPLAHGWSLVRKKPGSFATGLCLMFSSYTFANL